MLHVCFEFDVCICGHFVAMRRFRLGLCDLINRSYHYWMIFYPDWTI